jgi:glyoxylase-like metal-dependent hydrolase (beta-lactamase superfamily II)
VQSAGPADPCPICADERQYVGWDGQRWTTQPEMEAAGFRNRIEEIEPDLWGIGTEPRFAIGQRSLLVRTPAGNLLWDVIGYLDAATIRAVAELGGVAAVSASHPHFYGSIVEWSRAFDAAPIYLPAADREWVQRDDPAFIFYDEAAEPLPGITLIRCGGHFDGSAVAHWPQGADGRGALLTGDTIQVVSDRRYVSFMRSYPNEIPLDPATILRIVAAVAPYRYDRIYGGWWERNILTGARDAVAASARRYIRWLEGGG